MWSKIKKWALFIGLTIVGIKGLNYKSNKVIKKEEAKIKDVTKKLRVNIVEFNKVRAELEDSQNKTKEEEHFLRLELDSKSKEIDTLLKEKEEVDTLYEKNIKEIKKSTGDDAYNNLLDFIND